MIAFKGSALAMGVMLSVFSGAWAVGLPVPANVLELSRWHLTLPVDANGNSAGAAEQINQPQLATYQLDPWFRVAQDAGTGRQVVAFRAFAGGAKTSANTIFARSELREHDANYGNMAWAWNDGLVHSMRIVQSIAALTKVHPHTAAGQIHDEGDDVFMLKAEGTNPGGISTKAVLNAYFDNSKDSFLVDPAYVLGTPFELEVIQSGRGVTVKYKGKVVVDSFTAFTQTTRKANYFKAGCYIQTNPSKYAEDPAAYAEVRIFELTTTHAKGSAGVLRVARVEDGPSTLYSPAGRLEMALLPGDLAKLGSTGLPGVRSGLHLVRQGRSVEPVLVP